MNNQNKNSDWASWIPIVVLFFVPYTWPIALFLLFRKLMGLGSKKRRPSHPYDIQRQQAQQRQQAAQQAQQTQQPRQAAAPPPPPNPFADPPGQSKFPKGRGLTIAGGILTGVFGFASILEFADALSWGGLVYELDTLLPLVALLCLGLVLLTCGVSRTRKGKRLRKYLSLIGRRKSVSIEALARVTGASRRKVTDDLQSMLDSGLLPTGYLDLSRDLLVLSDEGIPDEAPQPEAPPAQEKPQDDYAVLQEIRAVNDAIPDPVMSQKIDRIGEITGKILDYQRQHPGQSDQLRSFLNYYLPTTLKILRAYAQLDAQGVEGENISAAKARIEGMMDKVVEGFEKQLDKLFQDSAMDISSDVSVLEQMLEKDGLAGTGQGMTL
jgi:hypothetical protein